MAVTNYSGLTITQPQVGIQITKVTDSQSDFSSVSNSTYFYNKSDKLAKFKDSYGNVVNLFESNYSLSGTGTNIHFSASTIFGSSTTPETGNITNTLTNSKLGVVQKIYHNSGSAPTVPVGWVLLGSTTYQISTLNIIYAEWARGSRVEYWIVR
jgi:hypothetical protein